MQKSGHPDRVPATYTRKECTGQLLLAFNYRKGTLFGRLRRRKTSKNILSFLVEIRRHYPSRQRIHIIMDNLSAHSTDRIVAWTKENGVSFAPTPTNVSWLNPIECHIADIERMAFKNTNYTKWSETEDALMKAIRYKNTQERNTRQQGEQDEGQAESEEEGNMEIQDTELSYLNTALVSTSFNSSVAIDYPNSWHHGRFVGFPQLIFQIVPPSDFY